MKSKSKTFYRYFLSYALVLILPVALLFLLSYTSLLNRFSAEIAESNTGMLTQMQENLDARLEQLINVAYMIQNDSVINTKSGEAPLGAPRVDVAYHTDPADFKPGVWHVFPAARGKDHMSFVGWLEKKEDFEAFYKKMYTDVSSVPTINK